MVNLSPKGPIDDALGLNQASIIDEKVIDRQRMPFHGEPAGFVVVLSVRCPVLYRWSLFSGLSPQSKTHLPDGSAAWSVA